ncbi:uncharacterized protein G2W53_034961 [Senna tora]|uniref:Uncharacterized protein n=1 Tax=Senna tora TaxID=362788 RepID=A0A834W4H2_9FABA|nr:uncharacterized protein G2W53_034961 [Senna tora]
MEATHARKEDGRLRSRSIYG